MKLKADLPGILIVMLLGALSAAPAISQGRYIETADYLRSAFAGSEPVASTLWVTGELRQSARTELGYELEPLRIRFWQHEGRTAWILDEIGKERPITIGVVVEDNAASMVRVLEFRETRGWEVKYPFFTDQFENVRLDSRRDLDHTIDSITGNSRSALECHQPICQSSSAR